MARFRAIASSLRMRRSFGDNAGAEDFELPAEFSKFLPKQ
jgi:hypothetical protein